MSKPIFRGGWPVRVASTAVLLAAVIAVGSCTPNNPKFTFSYAEKRGLLESNGLRFVIIPDKTTELVQVDIRYDVGSREDPAGMAGIAHVVEHLMFQTRPDGPDSPPLFQSIATLSSGFNAYTNWDSTHYETQGRKELLSALLKIEAMRLYWGCRTVSNEEFEREREVVRNEIRQRGGTPEGMIVPLTLQAIYPEGHPYRQTIGGDDAQLSTIKLSDTCEFMDKYYTPSNATLVIAGNVDIDETVGFIRQYFEKIPQRKAAPRVDAPVVAGTAGKVTHALDMERPMVAYAWPLPNGLTPEGEDIMFGIQSAFFGVAQKAEEYDFATAVYPMVLGGKLAPMFAIVVELKSAGRLGEATEFARKAAASAYRGFDGGSWQQIQDMKARAKADIVESLEDLSSRTNTVAEIIQFNKTIDFSSTEEYLFDEFERIERFDGGRVGAAIKKYLDPDKMKVIVFNANKEGLKGDRRSNLKFTTKSHDKRVVTDYDPAEAKRPIKVATELKLLAGAERYTLKNGMRVVLLPVESMPVVSASLTFDVGDAHAAPLLAQAAADFLRLPLDAEAIQAAGIRVGCGTTEDHTICRSGGINIYLDVIVNGLERIVRAGEYSQEAIESWKKQMRDDMTRGSVQQDTEVSRQMLTSLFGAEHPYTLTGVAIPRNLSGIDKSSLTKFRSSHYTASNATLIVTGRFEPKQAKRIISKAFKHWGSGGKDDAIVAPTRVRTAPEFVGVVGKELPQMQVSIAYPATAGVDGLAAARNVLARMINNRLGNVRTKLGSTYGVYAQKVTLVGGGYYVMGGTVDAARAGESLAAMRDAADSLRRGEDFDVEFVRARRELINGLLSESTVSSVLLSRLGFVSRFNLGVGYYNTYLQQVAAMSPAQIKALIATDLKREHEVVVLLADKPTLEAAFKGAGITDVKFVEPSYE